HTRFSRDWSSDVCSSDLGQGSLYRHFPDRMALAVAVFDENVSRLEELVDAPSTTLDDFLNRVIEQALVSTAIIEMISLNRDDQQIGRASCRERGWMLLSE